MNGPEQWMRMAIESARKGIAAGQTPFGACIVRGGQVLAVAHNTVWETCDSTAHAEVTAIRLACATARSIDLSGAVIYTTCEPCPMCFAACHWAKLSRIVYGAAIADAQAAGFSELTVSNEELKRQGGSPIEIQGDFLREECRALFSLWLSSPQHRQY